MQSLQNVFSKPTLEMVGTLLLASAAVKVGYSYLGLKAVQMLYKIF